MQRHGYAYILNPLSGDVNVWKKEVEREQENNCRCWKNHEVIYAEQETLLVKIGKWDIWKLFQYTIVEPTYYFFFFSMKVSTATDHTDTMWPSLLTYTITDDLKIANYCTLTYRIMNFDIRIISFLIYISFSLLIAVLTFFSVKYQQKTVNFMFPYEITFHSSAV